MGVRLDPSDEYMHELGPESNFNESMYINCFDPVNQVGGWFRIGNRPNEGYAEMSKKIEKADFGGEAWVMGDYTSNRIPPDELKKLVRDKYAAAYIALWRKVMKEAAFIPYGSLGAAKDRLSSITASTAPIPGLLWWTSHNTAVDLPGVRAAFAAVQTVQPPSDTQQFIAGQLQNYNGGIINLGGPLDAATQQGADSIATAQALNDAKRNATQTTQGITAGLPVDSEFSMHSIVGDLMLRPIVGIPVPKAGGEVDAGGGAFCGEFNVLTNKFPFNPNSKVDLSLGELEAIFKPGVGRLSKFYQDTLQAHIQCPAIGQGECTKSPNSKLNISPTFISYISRAMRMQKALYPDGQSLNYKYSIKPTSEFYDRFTLIVDGDRAQIQAGTASKLYSFTPSHSSFSVEIIQKGNTSGQTIPPTPGLWSVFHFFAKADSINGNSFRFFVYSGQQKNQAADGRDLSYDFLLDTQGAPPIFSRDVLNSLKCVPKVVQN